MRMLKINLIQTNMLVSFVLLWIWVVLILPWQLFYLWPTQSPKRIKNSSLIERFETVPELQRMWIRPLPDVRSPDLLQASSPRDVFLSAPEQWGTYPARVSHVPSPITIRALPGSDSFVIQTIRWRDASPTAKTPHGNRLNAFDVTQTLTWSGTVRKAVPLQKGLPDPVKPKNVKALPKGKVASTKGKEAPTKAPPRGKEAPPKDSTKTINVSSDVMAQSTAVATNDMTFPASVNSLEWKWITSNAVMPLESLFQASPYVDPMKINDLQKISQWNILYANQTPLCLFHLEPWVWK